MSEKDPVKPVPDEFIKVIKDFIADIKSTFPEYNPLVDKWWKDKTFFNYIDDETERNNEYEKSKTNSLQILFYFWITNYL